MWTHSTGIAPRRGFTLVELLTVIAIVGILTAIIIPTVSRVRESSRTTRCLANLRQLGIATTLYAQDESRNFPYVYHVSGGVYWYHAISPYLGEANHADIFFCPSEDVRPATRVDLDSRTNYIANRRLFSDGQLRPDGSMPGRISTFAVPRPAEVGMYFDGAVNANGTSNHSAYNQTGQNSTSPSAADNIVPDMSATNSSNAILSWRHRQRINVAFVDGHVATVSLGELRYRNLQIAY